MGVDIGFGIDVDSARAAADRWKGLMSYRNRQQTTHSRDELFRVLADPSDRTRNALRGLALPNSNSDDEGLAPCCNCFFLCCFCHSFYPPEHSLYGLCGRDCVPPP